MKKIYSKILLIALCILSLSATAQIPSNQNGEFLSTENYLNDFNKIIIPKCCGETTVPNLIFFYNPFSALTNHDRIELAKEKSLNTWFNQQYQNIKSEIESQLHTTFPNFEEAKNTYFKHWEKKNLLSHANFVKDKYDNRINVRKGKRDKSVRNLKLLELREIELNIGNIDNTSYGS
ncbi:MAG TPA: hypothetical protein ENK46_01350, partial [Flavobacteriia bacterium]|nr:hypothetical protein [Flavobacteriia bacterium]